MFFLYFMLVFKEREVLGDESKSQDTRREDANRDGDLWQGRDVLHIAHDA